MKTFLFSFGLFFCITNLNAQSIKIKEPEFAGNIVYVNDSIGNGLRLEQQASSMKTSANAAAYIPVANLFAGKATTKSVIKGCCSAVQITEKSNIRFIIKVTNNTVDPTTVVNVFKLKQKKDTRTVELASASSFGSVKSGDIDFISFVGTKYGESSYLIEIPNLEVGEYAITLAERRDFFNMFGIH